MEDQQFFKLDKDVDLFLHGCSESIGKFHADVFDQNIWCMVQDKKITSPIEQYIFIALHLTFGHNFYPEIDSHIINGEHFYEGYSIHPQYELDNYRCDFMVSYIPRMTKLEDCQRPGMQKRVIVECDSQTWHERTEDERRYEKARDRAFIKAGFHAFHFTGKEIMADPLLVAAEIVAFVTDHDKALLYEACHAD